MHKKSEAQLARKYGPDAWEWMHNWGKVRNRLSARNRQRHNQRRLWVAALVPAVGASVATQVIIWFFRG